MAEQAEPIQMWQVEVRSLAAFREWAQRESPVLEFRRRLQQKLEADLGGRPEATYLGFCAVCESHQHFVYDRLYSDGTHVNWRERLVCKGCHLNNRLRLAWQTTTTITNVASDPIYLTEHLTPFAERLRRCAANLSCSEYLGEGIAPGQKNRRGVRHEDLTRLSFRDGSFKADFRSMSLSTFPTTVRHCARSRAFSRPAGRF